MINIFQPSLTDCFMSTFIRPKGMQNTQKTFYYRPPDIGMSEGLHNYGWSFSFFFTPAPLIPRWPSNAPSKVQCTHISQVWEIKRRVSEKGERSILEGLQTYTSSVL